MKMKSLRMFGRLLAMLGLFALLPSCGTPGSLRTQDSKVPGVSSKNIRGRIPLVPYYLPVARVEVYCYRTKILGEDRLDWGIRSVAVPDVTHPYYIDYDFDMLIKDLLHIQYSPEGFIERISTRREPKAADAVASLARAALSVAAPVPLPFKGDPAFPEFSELVFQKSFDPESLDQGRGTADVLGTNTFKIGERYFRVKGWFFRPGADDGKSAGNDSNACHDDNAYPPAGRYLGGFHYRPLRPVEVTIDEVTETFASAPYPAGIASVITFPVSDASNIVARLPGAVDGRAVLKSIEGEVTASIHVSGAIKSSSSVSMQTRPGATNIIAAGKDGKSIAVEIAGIGELERRRDGGDRIPLRQSQIIYCPDQTQYCEFYFPRAFLASQSFDLRLSAGTPYDVRATRDSEIFEVFSVPGKIVGPILQIPGGLFHVTVEHQNKAGDAGGTGADSGGGKDDGGNRRQPMKE